jgi:hypothetical protein
MSDYKVEQILILYWSGLVASADPTTEVRNCETIKDWNAPWSNDTAGWPLVNDRRQ